MAVALGISIDAPAPIAPRYTLRGAADASPPADPHFMYGGTLVGYPTGPAYGWELCDLTPADKTAGGVTAQEPFFGFMAVLGVACTVRGLDRTLLRERALAAFQVYEDAVVEKQFWNGSYGSANPHLTDAGAEVLGGGTAKDVITAFALLEQELAEHQQSGLIHVSPRLATFAMAANLVIADGAYLKTRLGTIVVPGQGYDGSKPEASAALTADNEYAFVTNAVRVMRAPEPQLLGASDAEAVNHGNNTFTFIVEREYVVAWDGAVQAAVLVDPSPSLA
jgi:hypothetical protein